jgi:hypothetical protein
MEGRQVEVCEGGEKEGATLGIGLLVSGMFSIQFLIFQSIVSDKCEMRVSDYKDRSI